MNDYYVYGYIRLDNNTYFYIGKGRNKRYMNRSNRSEEFNYIVKNIPYTIQIIANYLSEDDAYNIEEMIIKDLVFNKGYSISIYGFRKNDICHLVNRSWGGSTNFGYHHSDESRRKLSEAHNGKILSDETKKKLSELNTGENHPNYGKHLSQVTRERISQSLKGKKFSKERRERLSEAHKGIPNLVNRRKVKCIELDMEFESISQAREYFGKQLEISRACRDRSKTAGKLEDGTKLHWKYIE